MLGALAALLPAGAAAQQSDARQRTTETIVADGLAQLPAADAKVFNQVMGELAATGSKGVEMIAAMLVPADKGKNATFEYALNGVVAYVTDPAHEALRDDVRKGLLAAIDRCGDDANRAFLFSQLQFCSTAADAAAMARYLDDPYLADYALRALVSTPGTEALLLAEAGKDDLTAARKQALAYAFAEKRLAAAEPFLLTWLEGADAQTAEQIYNALAACGSQASVKPLAAAAAKTGCAWNDAGAADAYLRLLARLAAAGDARAVKAARGLLKCDLQYIRGGALAILVDALGAGKAMPYVLKAVEEGPAEYRYAALQSLGKGDDKLFAQVAAGMPRYDAAAQAAVIGWLGECGAVSQADVITAAVASPDDRVAEAAIAASGRIGGEKALRALAGALEGPHAGAAMKALLAFNGQINPEVERLLAKDDAGVLVPALKLAAARRMSAAADRVFALLGSSDAEVRAAAYGALPFVAQPQHMDRLSALLDASDEAHTAAIQSALIRTSGQLPADRRYSAVAGYMKASETPARYYPVLAQSGTQEAVASLLDGFRSGNRDAAFAALLTVENPAMVDVLYDILYGIAAENPMLTDRALMRYADLASQAAVTPIRRYQLYRQALALRPSAAVQAKLLGYLSGVYALPALMLAAEYLDDAQTAAPAAAAVKTIVAKCNPMPGGEAVCKALERAHEVYKELAKSDADAGYAVDELTGLLGKIPADGFAVLPADGLAGWTAVAVNPAEAKRLPARQVAKLRKAAGEAVAANWGAADGLLEFAAETPATIGTEKEYENFELWIEWRSEGEAGMAVRSMPLIRLGGAAGTGLADGKAARTVADNAPGTWNTLYVKVVDDRITLVENGVKVAENAVMTNLCAPGEPVYAQGRIELAGQGALVAFRNLWINELPSTPVFSLPADEAAAGYEVLFDGRSLYKWTGNTTNYVPLDGTIDVTATYGGSGNLYTVGEYGDFILRFEFRFLTEGVNNGIGIRTPMGVDAAFHGMEIQILDHDAPIYKDISDYQQHGSVYGVIAADRVKFGELGEWNTEEIRAVGDRITVTVNGRVILDGNIREACRGHNVSEDGSKVNPYTVDHRNHPGLFNKSGHIGLLGHGAGIQFRNLRVLDLGAGRK